MQTTRHSSLPGIMTPNDDEAARRRAGVQGRVVFAAAAYLMAIGLIVVVERVGVPEALVQALAPAVTLAALALVGMAAGSMRVARFYDAERAMPPLYAGLATTALAAGLFIPFVAPGSAIRDRSTVLWSLFAGAALAGLAIGPLLRQGAAVSLAALLAARFPGLMVRSVVAAVMLAAGGAIALGGFSGALHELVLMTGTSRFPAALALLGVLAVCGVPGGMAGIAWAAAAAAGMALAAFAIPLALSLYPHFDVPLPMLGDAEAWARAAARISQWHASAAPAGAGNSALLAAALVFGTAALASLLLPSVATPGIRSARRAGTIAVLGALGLMTLGAAAVALTALALDPSLDGRPPDRLPAWAYSASAEGLVTICGQAVSSPAAARSACAGAAGFSGTLRPEDLGAHDFALLTGLAQARGLGSAFSGMIDAALIGLQLALAAAGLFVIATTIAGAPPPSRQGRRGPASARLALSRGAYILALGLCVAYAASAKSLRPELLTEAALAVSGAFVTPLIVLSFWRRANSAAASIGLVLGLGAAALLFGPNPAALARASIYAGGAVLVGGLAASLAIRRRVVAGGNA